MKKQDFRAVGIIALGYLFIELLGVTCPIKFFTGISCAGCGMSRAWLALLQGDISLALTFHPLFFLPVPAVVLMLFWKRTPRRLRNVTLWGGVTVFLLVYCIRMLDPADSVVVFRPYEGRIWRAVEFVFNLFR